MPENPIITEEAALYGEDMVILPVRDRRDCQWFWLDHEALRWLPILGVKAFAVYVVLCRFANHEEQAFPTWGRLQNMTKLGRDNIRKALRDLEQHQLIRRCEQLRKGSFFGACTYELLSIPRAPRTLSDDWFSVNGESVIRKSVIRKSDTRDSVNRQSVNKEDLDLKKLKDLKKNKKKESNVGQIAQRILDHLNEVGHAQFRVSPDLEARLKQDVTEEECTLVIEWYAAVRLHQWDDAAQYFRPSTLFNSKRFPDYLAQAQTWKAKGKPTQHIKEADKDAIQRILAAED